MERFLPILGLLLITITSSLTAQQEVALLRLSDRPISTTFSIGNQDVVLPFELDRGMIYLAAETDMETGQFLLDTGAPSLVINEEPQPDEESPYTAQSCGATVSIGLKEVTEFSWAGIDLRDIEAITLDLSHLEEARKASVAGMIGYDLLKNYTLLLNYETEELALLRPRPWHKWSEHAPLMRIPFELSDHLPVIEFQYAGQILHLGIDTGAATNLLSNTIILSPSAKNSPIVLAEVQGLDQQISKGERQELQDVTYKDHHFSDEFLLLDLSHLQDESGKTLDGLLGYPFLSQYVVAIDYRRGELLLWEK